jgi:epoxyqueuosine reductase
VVALALSYLEPPGPEPEPVQGRVARYARGRDYHAVMKRRLKDLVSRLRQRDPGLRALASADVAPVMEKAWAERAGLGWVGKNGCLVTTDLGSWVLLATVLLDRELEPDAPHAERCGSCAECFPACPTGALVAPGLVDARRCLSFHTIERRGPVPEEVAERLGPWAFGCDDCQTVCPWNLGAEARCDPELRARPGQRGLDLDGLLALTLEEYRQRFYGTALARARYEGLLRNALLAAGQAADRRRLPAVRAHLASPFDGVRAAAAWAAARLERGGWDAP